MPVNDLLIICANNTIHWIARKLAPLDLKRMQLE